MPDLADGESTEVQGSGSSRYKLRNVGGGYSCSCPAWRNQSIATRFRTKLGEWYPAGEAEKVKHAEGFELCEYGAQPNKAELKRLFPFFD